MKRIQRKRTKGWRTPDNTVNVCRPSRWGNPYEVGKHVETNKEAVDKFRELIECCSNPDYSTLRGKDLACYCKPGEPCHADVLLEMANSNGE